LYDKFQIRIKVHYCGLNRRDLKVIQGVIPVKTPFVPGYEVSGEVIEKVKGDGKDDDDEIEVGDKVVALTKNWLGGLRSHCVASVEVGFVINNFLNLTFKMFNHFIIHI
jgi:NADPH:quinone reductase-like Zn-dependent oxidoreductase